MINLLPPEERRQLQASRANTLLIRYNIALAGALLFLLAAVAVSYFYLNSTKIAAEQTIQENKTKVSGYAAVQAQAEGFRTNLTTAKNILDKEVNYTKVILKIAALLPEGVILQTLSLDATTFGTPTTLVANAKTYDEALALKASFEKSPILSDVHFQSIAVADGGTSGAPTPYPVTITLSITIKKEAAK
jgi:Tfp pilus assembly protein PilN